MNVIETTKALKHADAGETGVAPRLAPARLDQPVAPLVIEPESSLSVVDLKDLWAHRELLYFLVWRDIKVRYKQTALGAAWAVLQPLLAAFVFTLVFGRLAGVEAVGGLPYTLFAYSGLLLWVFFSNAVTNSGNSLVGSSHLITKVYFPRVIIPAAAVAACALDLIIASALLLPLALWHGVGFSTSALVAPLFVLLMMLCALGTGLWMSALNVRYRDVRHALPFAVQLWMFVSSVIAPSSVVPAEYRPWLYLNPLTGIIENFRAALFGGDFNRTSLASAVVVTLFILFTALAYFRRTERGFADVV